MQGTSWLDRVGGAFASTRSAWKATPPPAALYAPRGMAVGASGPINFPGYPEWEARYGKQGSQDEARVKTALRSVSVYADVRAIATEASAAEIIVKERKGRKLEDVENHPLETLWERPNPHMGRSFVMEFWAWSYVMASKAFLYWVPASDGKPGEVWPVPPFMLTPIPDEKEFVKGYGFKARADSKPIIIPPQYITFSHSVNLFDPRDGLSFLAAVMLEVEGDIASAEWNRNFFAEQNGVPDGLITVPKDILTEDLARVRLELKEFFGGTRRGVAVAPAGEMDYKPFGRTQKDAEFLEGRKFAANAIGRALGFPDGYWSESANRANAEQARATMIAGAVWPILVRLAEDLNAQMIPRWYGDQFRAEFKDIRPEDRALKLQELQFYAKIETINELRERVGADAFEKTDPRGLMLLDELAKQSAIAGTPAAELMEAAAPEEEAVDPESMPPAEIPEGDELPSEEAGAPLDDAEEAPGMGEEETKTTPAAWLQAASEALKRNDHAGLFGLAEMVRAQKAQEDAMSLDEVEAAGKLLDKRRWQTKALKALRLNRSPAVTFKGDYLTEGEGAAILERLRVAQSVEDVRSVFKAKDDTLTPDEAALTDALTAALRDHQGAITEAAESGRMGSLVSLGNALASALTPALLARFTVGDLDLPPNAAEGWVADYLPAAIRGLNETTNEIVRAAITQARAGASQAKTAQRLASAFSPSRAEMIAITELTRASAQATTASQTYLAGRGIPSTQIWRTGNDEHTCPVCAPRNGARQGEGWDEPPPAHPRCRCFTTLDILR